MRDWAHRLTDRWRLKLLSLGFAVGLWAFVAAEDRGEALYTVPLDVEAPPGFEVTSLGTETVEVRLEGRRQVLARLRDTGLRARVTVREARAGEVQVRILPRDVSVPRGVRVVRVMPTRVRLVLEASGPSPGPTGGQGAQARSAEAAAPADRGAR